MSKLIIDTKKTTDERKKYLIYTIHDDWFQSMIAGISLKVLKNCTLPENEKAVLRKIYLLEIFDIIDKYNITLDHKKYGLTNNRNDRELFKEITFLLDYTVDWRGIRLNKLSSINNIKFYNDNIDNIVKDFYDKGKQYIADKFKNDIPEDKDLINFYMDDDPYRDGYYPQYDNENYNAILELLNNHPADKPIRCLIGAGIEDDDKYELIGNYEIIIFPLDNPKYYKDKNICYLNINFYPHELSPDIRFLYNLCDYVSLITDTDTYLDSMYGLFYRHVLFMLKPGGEFIGPLITIKGLATFYKQSTDNSDIYNKIMYPNLNAGKANMNSVDTIKYKNGKMSYVNSLLKYVTYYRDNFNLIYRDGKTEKYDFAEYTYNVLKKHGYDISQIDRNDSPIKLSHISEYCNHIKIYRIKKPANF